MMRIHIMHVPGVPEREAVVAQLQREYPNVCVHEDSQRRGAMWNWASVMACMASQASAGEWHVQLNDDVELLRGWTKHLVPATQFSPSPILGLAWTGTRRGAKAFEADQPYAVGPYLATGLALAYHRQVVRPLADFAHFAAMTDFKHDDTAAMIWLTECRGLNSAIVARSIFGALPTRSLMGHTAYASASHTILSPGPAYRLSFVRDNHMARREDALEVLSKVKEAGWKP